MVGIIDYGAGNIRSMINAIVRVGKSMGIEVVVSSDIEVLRASSKIILPGVGAFGDVMKNLKESKIDEFVREWIRSGRKFMGVCVGLQVLFEIGYENGTYEGLGILKGEVVRFRFAQPIPHIGWNQVNVKKETLFFNSEDEGKYFYFVHSFYANPKDNTVVNTTTDYNGEVFTSSILVDNIFAVQFHPEKSHKNGENIIRKFLQNF